MKESVACTWLGTLTGTELRNRERITCRKIYFYYLRNCSSMSSALSFSILLAASLDKNNTTGEVGSWPTVLAKA